MSGLAVTLEIKPEEIGLEINVILLIMIVFDVFNQKFWPDLQVEAF